MLLKGLLEPYFHELQSLNEREAPNSVGAKNTVDSEDHRILHTDEHKRTTRANSNLSFDFLPNKGKLLHKDELCTFLRILNPDNPRAAYEAIKRIWNQDGYLVPSQISKRIFLSRLKDRKKTIRLYPEGERISIEDVLEKLNICANNRLRHRISGYTLDGPTILGLSDAYSLETKQPLSLIFGDFINIKGTNLYFEALLEKVFPNKFSPLEKKKKAETMTDLASKHISQILRREILKELKETEAISGNKTGFFGMGGDEIGIITCLDKKRIDEILDRVIKKIEETVDLMKLNNHKHTKEGRSPGFGISLGGINFNDISAESNREDILVRAEEESELRSTNRERTYRDLLNFDLISQEEAKDRLEKFLEVIKSSKLDLGELAQIDWDSLTSSTSKTFDTRSPMVTKIEDLFQRNPELNSEEKKILLSAAIRLIKTDFATGLQLTHDVPYYMKIFHEDSQAKTRLLNLGFENLTLLNHHLGNHELTNHILFYLSQIIKSTLAEFGLKRFTGALFTKTGGKFLMLIPNIIEKENPETGKLETKTLSSEEQIQLCDSISRTLAKRVEEEINQRSFKELLEEISSKFPNQEIDLKTLRGLDLNQKINELENPRRKDEYGVALYHHHKLIEGRDFKSQLEKSWDDLEKQTENLRAKIQRKPKINYLSKFYKWLKSILGKYI